MTMYTLTVSTAALGLGILSNVRVTIQRKKTVVSDTFPSASLTFHETLTNASGVANISLAADDGTVFHEIRVYSSRNMVIYYQAFSMPPQNVALEALPLIDIITESAYQAAASAQGAAASAASIRIDAETFASIPPLVNSCFVFVDADETNGNLPTVYFFDGTSLQWLPTVGV